MADAEAMHAILRDPAAMRYWSSLPHKSLDETETWLDATIRAIDAGRSDDFVIESDGMVVGKAGLWSGNEIGFLLAPSTWGRGYAREALQAVIDRGFDVSGHADLRAEADPRNERCLALLARLGFVEAARAERTWCIGGEWSDSVYLTLDRVAWRRPGSALRTPSG